MFSSSTTGYWPRFKFLLRLELELLNFMHLPGIWAVTHSAQSKIHAKEPVEEDICNTVTMRCIINKIWGMQKLAIYILCKPSLER